MSKKHFEALADALAASRHEKDPKTEHSWTKFYQWLDDVNAVADVCNMMAPTFDRDRFVAACKER